MARTFGRRIAVLFLLAVCLITPWAAAEPRDDRGAAAPQLLAQLWSWLSALWVEAGCGIDPDGRCGAGATPANLDAGCIIDPDGRCGGALVVATPDEGCIIDPNGGCRH
jgi:hypothetical protein